MNEGNEMQNQSFTIAHINNGCTLPCCCSEMACIEVCVCVCVCVGGGGGGLLGRSHLLSDAAKPLFTPPPKKKRKENGMHRCCQLQSHQHKLK